MSGNDSQQPLYVIGIDLGGTKIAAGIYECHPSGKTELVKAAEKKRLKDVFAACPAGKLTADAREKLILEAIGQTINELRDGFGERISGVGICSAGFVEDGVIVEAWNTGVENFALRDEASKLAGLPVLLIKDSWAPVYALMPGKASIVFSIGTGLGGVSCDADHSIPLKSYTANRRLRWIPYLYCNDDPGYAVSFSEALCGEIILRALRELSASGGAELAPGAAVSGGWAKKFLEAARERKRVSPSRLELFFARRLAPQAVAPMRHGEVYADFACSAEAPAVLYEIMTGEKITPPEMDALLTRGDRFAGAALRIQAGFLGYVFHVMQRERLSNGLAPALAIFGTGSGYNGVTHKALSEKSVADMKYFGAQAGFDYSGVEPIYLIEDEGGDSTFACRGAAAAAAYFT